MTDDHLKLVFDAGKFFLGTIVGAFVSRRVTGQAELISFWGHVSAFRGNNAGTQYVIHTHEVVLRNAGRQAAHNVRVTHAELPQFNITPSLPYTIETLPDGKKDIVIPMLVPNQQIVIAYLYFPPLTVTGVNAGIRCDEGFPKIVEMQLFAKTPKWILVLIWAGLIIGVGTVLYWSWRGLTYLGL